MSFLTALSNLTFDWSIPDKIYAWGTLTKSVPIAISFLAFMLALKTSRDQRRMTRNKFLIDLYHEIKYLKAIRKTGDDSENVVRVANALDLIGIAVHEKMIKEKVIRHAFREAFVDLYESINQAIQIMGTKRTGSDVLQKTPYARYLYKEFKKTSPALFRRRLK